MSNRAAGKGDDQPKLIPEIRSPIFSCDKSAKRPWITAKDGLSWPTRMLRSRIGQPNYSGAARIIRLFGAVKM